MVQTLPTSGIQSQQTEALLSSWLGEFKYWRTEKEEYQEFAQTLLEEFQNWKTAEEENQEYARLFLTDYFDRLPQDIIQIIQRQVWRDQVLRGDPLNVRTIREGFKSLWGDSCLCEFKASYYRVHHVTRKNKYPKKYKVPCFSKNCINKKRRSALPGVLMCDECRS